MNSLLVDEISQLITCNESANRPGDLGVLANAGMIVAEGQVQWVGASISAPAADQRISLNGRTVVPGFVDSHTHLIHAGDRSDDFVRRFSRPSQLTEGIASTIRSTRLASDEELTDKTRCLFVEMLEHGTTTAEIKSGYGLTVHDERRTLRIAAEFTSETTYMGAHVVPPEYEARTPEYVDLVVGDMLHECAPYAKWIDAWCEPGTAFDEGQARAILHSGSSTGLQPRLHANQYGYGPGVRLACELNLNAVDHCTFLTVADIDALASTGTVATLLPAVEYCTPNGRFSDGRAIIDAGGVVAIATDCNPGSAFTTSMPFCISLSVRELGLSPAEALWAATRGGAQALGREDIGTLRPGARADFLVLDAPNYAYLAYRPGVRSVIATFVGGIQQNGRHDILTSC